MKKLLFAFALLVLLQLSLCYYLLHGSEKKIAYADAIRLFNEYKFKTDLEKESQGTLQRLKAELDSVGVIYKVNPDNEQVQRMMMEKQQHFTEGCNAVNKTINEKVWERLNVKIQEFGKKAGDGKPGKSGSGPGKLGWD